jgi:hypothetical protein
MDLKKSYQFRPKAQAIVDGGIAPGAKPHKVDSPWKGIPESSDASRRRGGCATYVGDVWPALSGRGAFGGLGPGAPLRSAPVYYGTALRAGMSI